MRAQGRWGGEMKLTPKQAAERAGVSPALIYLWCAERRLRHLRAGGRGRRGRILIDRADLDAFLKSLEVAAEEPAEESPRPARAAGGFRMLDQARLLEAWQRQGARAARRGGGSAP